MPKTARKKAASPYCVIMLGCLLAATAHDAQPACTPSTADTAWKPINDRDLSPDVGKAIKASTIAEAIATIGSPYLRSALAGSETAWWLYGSQRKSINTDCIKPPSITYTTEFYLLSISRLRNRVSCSVDRRVYLTETPHPDAFAKAGLAGFTVSRSSCSRWLKENLRRKDAD